MAEEYFLGNTSENGSNCTDGYYVESTIYRKVLGTIIFVLVWPFIVLDFKWFPLGRPAAALVGSVFMVVFVVVPQDQVYFVLGERGNLQTLFLLIGMMLLSYYYDREGILQYISLWIFGKNKPFKHVLWKVCVLSAVLSAIITNDATCLVLTPLLLNEHMKQKRPEMEYPPLLLGIATSSNIGSAATFFGNPQNAYIAANSEGEVSLLIFFITTLPAALMGMFLSISVLYLCYFRTIWVKRDTLTEGHRNAEVITKHEVAVPIDSDIVHPEESGMIAASRKEISLSYDQSIDPLSTSFISKERRKFHNSSEILSGHVQSREQSFAASHQYGAVHGKIHLPSARLSHLDTTAELLESSQSASEDVVLSFRKTWRQKVFLGWLILVTCMVVILLAIPPIHSVEFNLGLVPVGAGVMTMLADTILNRKYAFDAMIKVDWTIILMFMGLFIWLTGFENTQFPATIFEFLRRYMDLSTVQGVLVFIVFVAIGSNVLSNVPLVILISDQLAHFVCGEKLCAGQLTGVLLAWVSTIAGNFTLIGSIANLIVAEKGRSVANYRLGFWEYLKFGFCSTLVVLFAGLPFVYFTAKHVHIKI